MKAGDEVDLDGHRWAVITVAPGRVLLRRLDRRHIVRIAPVLPEAVPGDQSGIPA